MVGMLWAVKSDLKLQLLRSCYVSRPETNFSDVVKDY